MGAQSGTYHPARLRRNYLIHLWNRLTQPSPALNLPEDRQQARLLAAMLVLLIPINGFLLIYLHLFVSSRFVTLADLTFLALIIAYGFSRTPYTVMGAAIGLLVTTLTPLAAVIADSTQIYVLVFLAVSIFFSSIFFSQRVTGLLVLGELLALVGLLWLKPETNAVSLIILMVFVLTEAALILVVMMLRQQDQAQHEAQARAISDSELRYRLIADNATDMICRHTLDGALLYVSPACQSLLGYTPEELLNQTPYDYIHPDDQGVVRDSYNRVLATPITDTTIYRFRRNDGSYVWFETTSRVIRDPQTGTPWEILTVSRDVSRRKFAEERLQASEARFRAAAEGSLDAFYVMKSDRDESGIIVDFVFVDLNQRGAELVRMTPERMIGQRVCELLPLIRTGGFFDQYVSVVETGIPLEAEFRINPTGIGEMWLLHQVVPVGDGIAVTARDITERKRADDDLRHTNLRLEAARDAMQRLIQQMPIGVQVFDTDGLCTDCNQSYMDIFGVATREQVIGKFNILKNLSSDRNNVMGAFRRAVSGEITTIPNAVLDFSDVDNRFSSRKGWLYLTVSFFPVYDENHEIVSVVALNQDVTARRLAEDDLQQTNRRLEASRDTLQRLTQQMPIGIQVFDRNGVCTDVNEAHVAIFGLHSREQVIGKFNILADQFAEKVGTQQGFLRALKGEVAHVEEVEFDFKQADPRFTALTGQRFLSVSFFPVFDENDEIVSVVALNEDITEERQAERERLELALERERVQMLQHLISDTSHDLKTPLATLNTSLYLLKKSISDPERRDRYTEVLQAQVVNLSKILDDMDSMARLDSADEAFIFEPTDLNDFVRQIVTEHEAVAAAKNQQLNCSCGEDTPLMPVDKTKLRRAITNLLTNALNYTPEGGSIEARTYLRNGTVIIEVSDNGMGIPQEEVGRIFDRFYRAEASRKSLIHGSGLGLAICKKIVEAHGGAIEVESVEDEGSSFRILLPMAPQ
jgi:PAS domain S-box-containing protein